MMDIVILETFMAGSHKKWAEDLQKFSKHNIKILSLSGHHWKWRMHGGAVTLARKFNEDSFKPDLILATDMVDLTTFLALTRERTGNTKTAIYFHENQLTYPWNTKDPDIKKKRDHHYGFINYSSALAANKVIFNSSYHKESFLGALPGFLKSFPDQNELNSIEDITNKSVVLPLGLDLERIKVHQVFNKKPVIIWNHRWEHDKNPEAFFNCLFELDAEGFDFEIIIAGENYETSPEIFDTARLRLKNRIIHFGYARSFDQYVKLLNQADILPVTSYHDFFGASVVEAIACGCVPLLPNRLAYPEHIHSEEKHLFYESDKEFKNKLKGLIKDFPFSDKPLSSSYVMKYNWSDIIKSYDSLFESI